MINKVRKKMKYAVLSDVHGNWEALTAVLAKCQEVGVDEYISLGDIVGYNANPKECLDTMRNLKLVCTVKGNHDEYAASGDDTMEGFNPHARAAVIWTKSQLTPEDRAWLAALPMRQTIKGTLVTAVHATLDSPDSWGYIFDVHHAADNFAYQFTPLCFIGHSHVPVAFCKKPISLYSERMITDIESWEARNVPPSQFGRSDSITISLEPGHKYLLNVGSVGQPRNHDPRASFAVYDSDLRTVTRYRVPYDIRTAQEKILAAGLPERLATRLEQGT
ncbi:MAG: metallophosphatase family protein [Lentisphaeria bacterium]|nr:metallophosphatase family protein [Lentisphaeria bacterium]